MKKHTITVFETTFLDKLKIMLMLWLFRYKLERHTFTVIEDKIKY